MSSSKSHHWFAVALLLMTLFSLPANSEKKQNSKPSLSAKPDLNSPGSKSARSPEQIKRNTKEYRELMVNLTRQLGVTCNTCHDTNNFADPSKAEFVVAKDHLRIVQVLIDAGMNGKGNSPKADCYMCHRGELKPKHKEPIDPLTNKPYSKAKFNSDEKSAPSEGDPE